MKLNRNPLFVILALALLLEGCAGIVKAFLKVDCQDKVARDNITVPVCQYSSTGPINTSTTVKPDGTVVVSYDAPEGIAVVCTGTITINRDKAYTDYGGEGGAVLTPK